MTEYKKKAVNTASYGIIIWSVLSILLNAFNIILIISSEGTELFSVAQSVIALGFIAIPALEYSVLTKGYSKTVKLRLLPFALVPSALFLFSQELIGAFLRIIPFEIMMKRIVLIDTKSLISSIEGIVATAGALVIYLLLSKKLIEKYIDLFFADFYIQFPREFNLKSKWWFALAADLIYSLITGIFSGGVLAFISARLYNNEATRIIFDIINSAFSFGLLFLELFLFIAFFKKAFKNVNEAQRKLFYPLIVVFFTVGDLIGKASSPLTSFIYGKYNPDIMSGAQSGILVSSGIIITVTMLLTYVVSILLISKSLEAFEKNPCGIKS